MRIVNSTLADIDFIFELYALATAYQKTKFPDNQWPKFERSLVENEISDNRQWKMVIDNKIACVWAITFSDPQIWEDKNSDPSIYIHRIATNPAFRGQQFVLEIVKWAKQYAAQKNKSFIRMDTCGNNVKLIEHYQNSGFNFLGIQRLKDTGDLPAHYQNAAVCLFEIALGENK